jgi:hypothetical protein
MSRGSWRGEGGFETSRFPGGFPVTFYNVRYDHSGMLSLIGERNKRYDLRIRVTLGWWYGEK